MFKYHKENEKISNVFLFQAIKNYIWDLKRYIICMSWNVVNQLTGSIEQKSIFQEKGYQLSVYKSSKVMV